jgi:hypothetical protein
MFVFSIIDHPIFSNLPVYQQQLSYFFVSYWIPAILIYLILILTRLGSWLKLSGSAYGSIGLANIFVFSLFVARFASSSVPSGGGGIIITVFSLFFIVPAIVLIIYGHVRMIISSIRHNPPKNNEKAFWGYKRLNTTDRTLLSAALVTPILFGINIGYSEGSPFQKARATAPLFEERCKDAIEEVYLFRNDAKNILIADPKWLIVFGYIKNGFYKKYAEGTAPFKLLMDFELDFVESEIYSSSTEYLNGFKYWRFEEGFPADRTKKYAIYEHTSDYALFLKEITNSQDQESGITGYKMEIIDLRSQEIIASKIYFIHKEQSRICGYAPHTSISEQEFVQRSLNLKPRSH